MSFRSKHDPADHEGDDIYTSIFDEAMTVLTGSTSEPTPAALALYVTEVLWIDPEDLPLVERLVTPAFEAARNPEFVACWRRRLDREIKARRKDAP